ncbi:MAG TPA: DUF2007 domain-containing protein [Gaiellaceae bacterium]|nr:DUF2007 domain-containing protein [Gaiellaceae bacterium]
MADVVAVATAPNEAIAEMWCSVLRAHGIECAHKRAGGAFPYGAVGGERLILVSEQDAERAGALLETSP